MKGLKDDSAIFEEFSLNERAREHLEDLTATEVLALKTIGIKVLRDPETGKNVII